jgi:hypothetical protein
LLSSFMLRGMGIFPHHLASPLVNRSSRSSNGMHLFASMGRYDSAFNRAIAHEGQRYNGKFEFLIVIRPPVPQHGPAAHE